MAKAPIVYGPMTEQEIKVMSSVNDGCLGRRLIHGEVSQLRQKVRLVSNMANRHILIANIEVVREEYFVEDVAAAFVEILRRAVVPSRS